MQLFDAPDFDDHEQVCFFFDAPSQLRAIVAIHASGPIGTAGGGCRMRVYPDDAAALQDALRLSKAMSYKLALAGLPGGGAKSIILGDPHRDKSEALLRAFGRAVESMAGRYIVAEDVGTTARDMEIIATETSYVVGRVDDTSPATGFGVFVGLRTAVEHALHRRDLEGLTVAIQGVGGVGFHLGEELTAAGAKLYVSDVDREAVRRAVDQLGAVAVPVHDIHGLDVDVFAPCALGGTLDDATIPRLRAKVIAGGANNQLAEDRHARVLAERGILYAPDFVINAGGVIAAALEVEAFADDVVDAATQRSRARTGALVIEGILREVFSRAARDGLSTHEAAVRLAKERLSDRSR